MLDRLRRRIDLWPIRRYREIEGWLTKREALGLYRLARGLPDGARVVEIGSWKGKSTYCLALGLKSGTIFAVDPFDGTGEGEYRYPVVEGEKPIIDQFRDNLRGEGLLHKVEVNAGLSSSFAGRFHDIDLLFIDGDHSIAGCRYDFETFAPEVKPGGILAFHDYHADRPDLGPTWVVDNLVAASGKWRLAEMLGSLVVFRRAA